MSEQNKESIQYFHSILVEFINRSGLSMEVVLPAVLSVGINLLIAVTDETDEKIIHEFKNGLKEARINAAILEQSENTEN